MNADYMAAKSAMKENAFLGNSLQWDAVLAIPPKPTTVTVFPALPPANESTFNASLPLLATSDKATVIVLYAPNLQSIGSIDNSKSQASAGYSKAVQSGFTFTMNQTLTATASIEVNVQVVKAGLTIGLSLSFTEAWSSSTTETISFEVPSGQMAFLYQGFMLASILTYDGASGQFSFGDAARCLTPVLVTSSKPITGTATIAPPTA